MASKNRTLGSLSSSTIGDGATRQLPCSLQMRGVRLESDVQKQVVHPSVSEEVGSGSRVWM
jgi:hypothetical protein